ncbi:MAG: peptide-methionine (S)-S-oxide reductase MsrA [Gammaproteobacteria bacterium]|nr:peptide-methionine (S)-S-oxide reductase MsrA [Gammaproteobacteria bacterium]
MNRLLSVLIAATAAAAQPLAAQQQDSEDTAVATFAGGCFWCVEEAFDKVDGVLSTTSGYIGGDVPDPSYEQVSQGNTGHAEAVRIEYDPETVSYQALLDTFWHNIDPLDAGGQFCDRGDQYRSAIFYHDERQKELAQQSKRQLEERGVLPGGIVTEIVPATEFYAAEDYHQDYYEHNALRYEFYKFTCGRPSRLEELWGEK